MKEKKIDPWERDKVRGQPILRVAYVGRKRLISSDRPRGSEERSSVVPSCLGIQVNGRLDHAQYPLSP